MSEIAAILDRAADLIEPEGAWTRYDFARDRFDRSVPPDSPFAVCYCARGAVYHVASVAPDDEEESHCLFRPLVRTLGLERYSQIEEWNDAPERTQAEVVAKLREAAALAREQGQ